MIPKTDDGRVLFAVPWLGKLVLGTTDTPVNTISLEPSALEEEINFILQTSAQYLTRPPRKEDVLSVFAGLRPLADSGDSEKTKEISRSHKIDVSRSGLFTIIGGKWTTFRKMAEDLVNRVESVNKLKKTRTKTPSLHIHGFRTGVDTEDPLYLYGSEADKIRGIGMEKGNSGIISEKLQISVSQVIYSIREEMAIHVEDVLARRTRALLLDAKEAVRIARPVAGIMAAEGGFDNDWIEEEVRNFTNLSKKYIL
jgi:glycerol-3-phosphate dehydrogenase